MNEEFYDLTQDGTQVQAILNKANQLPSKAEYDATIRDINTSLADKIGKAISITYAALKALRDGGTLKPGQLYRITDYVTTTALEDTQSAGHQFDIIVRADANNKLNEKAYATIHSGDTYLANSKLEAWKLKYTLENDSTRFIWADEDNGKGVIYFMEDEFGNKCSYDFKNILFKRFKTTKSGAFYHNLYFGFTSQGSDYPSGATFNKNDVKYLYTFTTYTSNYGEIKDASLNTGENGVTCWQNVIPACYDAWGDYVGVGYLLNNIVLQGNGGNFYNNSFGAGCVYCSIGNSFSGNTIGNNFFENSIGNDCYNNTIGNYFQNNTIGNNCYENSIGNSFQYNTIGNYFNNNTIGNSFYNNSIGEYFNSNTIGNNVWGNTIGNSFGGNTIGNNFQDNTIGNNCYWNTIGNDCNNFTIGKDYVRYIEIEDGNKNFTLTSTQTTSSSNYLQNICISRGTSNDDSNPKTISHNSVGDGFKTTYQNSNSTTVNV
jgi:hypothetical protein